MTKKVSIYVNNKLFIDRTADGLDVTLEEVISKFAKNNYDFYNTKSPNTKKFDLKYKSLSYYSSLNAMSNTLILKGVFIDEIYSLIDNDLRINNLNRDKKSRDNKYFKYLKTILQDNVLITFDVDGQRMLTGYIDRVNMAVKKIKTGSDSDNSISFDIVVYDSTFDIVKNRISDGKDIQTVDNLIDVIKSLCLVNLVDADKNGDGGIFIHPLYIRLQKTLNYNDLNIANTTTRGNIGQSVSDFLQDLAKIKGLVIRGNGMGGIDIYSLNIDDNTYNIIFENFKNQFSDDLESQKKVEQIKSSELSFIEKRDLISELLNSSTYNITEKSKLETEVFIRKTIKNYELINFYNNISFNNNYDYYRISEGTSALDNSYTVSVSKSFRFNEKVIDIKEDIKNVINNIYNIELTDDVILPDITEDSSGYIIRNRGYSKIIAEGEILEGFDTNKYSIDLINQNNKIASLQDTVLIIEVLYETFSNLKLKIGDFVEISNKEENKYTGEIGEYFIPYDFNYDSIVVDENGERVVRKINYYLLSKIEIKKSDDGEICILHLSYRDAFTKYAMRESV